MTGSMLTGVLWDQFGPQVPFFLSSGISLIIVILFFIFKTQ
jgi:hypothetical protein